MTNERWTIRRDGGNYRLQDGGVDTGVVLLHKRAGEALLELFALASYDHLLPDGEVLVMGTDGVDPDDESGNPDASPPTSLQGDNADGNPPSAQAPVA